MPEVGAEILGRDTPFAASETNVRFSVKVRRNWTRRRFCRRQPWRMSEPRYPPFRASDVTHNDQIKCPRRRDWLGPWPPRHP